MKEQQTRKNCQAFINKLHNSNVYQNIRELLYTWKRVQNKQNVPAAIDTFMKISKVVHGFGQEQKDEKLIQIFNRCLVKQAIVPKKNITNEFVQDAASENPQATKIVENMQEWVNKQNKQIEKPVIKPVIAPQQIKDNVLMTRFQSHPKFRQIAKIIQLYLKSIISYDQIRSLLTPLYASDPSLIANLIQTAQEIIQKRRKATVFASLNQLVDKKYPNLERVGQSYILIPEGYANYSRTWKTSPVEHIMNRKCVSVPLGSEVSFIINKKTDYQEQLFSYEDQRYEIDNTLCSLRAILSLFSSNISSRKLGLPLLQKVINQIYPNENVGNIFVNNPELAKNILLPRIIQKRDQLIACRQKFVKTCEQIASKNFYKSLDYRCFYFAKNDKKFNCPARWQNQIQMRRTQILENKDTVQQQQVQDRQSLQRGRYFYVNSFDNITKQNFIQNKQIIAQFDRKVNTTYPKYPNNQILFILNFADQQILNDVLEVILYYCNRKSLLQLLVFKLIRTDIKKRLKKSTLLNYLIENKQKIVNNNQIIQIFANLKNPAYVSNLQQQGFPEFQEVLLNQGKGMGKNFKDSQQQFIQMIQEDQEPVQIQDQQIPFQGPQSGYTLIATKQIYLFLRYLTTIYQRFLKAKQYSQQFSSTLTTSQDNSQQRPKIDIYNFFLTVIYKIKDKKYFQQYMRKIFCKNAFIFFTLQKMILGVVKIINNITKDSLTYQIIKDQTKDYELGAFDWQKFIFPSVTMQLTRLYLEKQTLFRFTYEPNQKNFYISAWNPPHKDIFLNKQYNEQLSLKIQQYTTKPIKTNKSLTKNKKSMHEQIYNAQQVIKEQNGKLILRGQFVIANVQGEKQKEKKLRQERYMKIQINKLKKMKKKYQ